MAEDQVIAQHTVDTPPSDNPAIKELKDILQKAADSIPAELKDRISKRITSLERLVGTMRFYEIYDDLYRYLDWVVNLPWYKETEDNLDLQHTTQILESTHYGLQSIKDRILEYVAVLTLQKQAAQSPEREEVIESLYQRGASLSPILLFVGLPGVGKTSIAFSIAKALGRQFIRIPMGGMGSAAHLRGEPRSQPGAEPSLLIKGMRQAGARNPVILLDEVDRVAESARADIMGVLLELLDPQQNRAFVDYYINYPFDLSRAIFLCSANKTGNIANAVLDRMEVIQMPGYTDEEKIVIARDYLLPQELQIVGMAKDDVQIEDSIWPLIIRPFGFDAGIRTTHRTIAAIVRKCARQRVAGVTHKFVINQENYRDYLPEV